VFIAPTFLDVRRDAAVSVNTDPSLPELEDKRRVQLPFDPNAFAELIDVLGIKAVCASKGAWLEKLWSGFDLGRSELHRFQSAAFRIYWGSR
jgi:hypothetical protein